MDSRITEARFPYYRSKCFATSPSQLKMFALSCPWLLLHPAVLRCSACTEPPSLAVSPACPLAHPMPHSSCASSPRLRAERAVLAQPLLASPSHPVCWCPPSSNSTAPAPSSVPIVSSASCLDLQHLLSF